MSATGMEVFDKTLQTTHIWLNELGEEIGPDRQLAWHTLGAVLRGVRDQLPADLAAHLGSQLPLLVRGTYYNRFRPSELPNRQRSLDGFLQTIEREFEMSRPVNVRNSASAVFRSCRGTSTGARSTRSDSRCRTTSGRSGTTIRTHRTCASDRSGTVPENPLHVAAARSKADAQRCKTSNATRKAGLSGKARRQSRRQSGSPGLEAQQAGGRKRPEARQKPLNRLFSSAGVLGFRVHTPRAAGDARSDQWQ